MHASGVGKALAAGMDDQDIAAAIELKLEPMTDKSYRTVEQVLEDIQAVRKLGYAIEDEQMEEGIRCIGAPIYGPDAKVVASVSGKCRNPYDSEGSGIYDIDRIFHSIRRVDQDCSEVLLNIPLHLDVTF